MTDGMGPRLSRRRVMAAAGLGLAGAAAGAPARAQDAEEEARKAVAVSYLRSLDMGGVSPETGVALFDHFAPEAEVFFPKWGVAKGRPEVERLFADVGGTLKGITHDYDNFVWHMTGTESFAVEGTSKGEHRDGTWDAATGPAWGAGRFCDCFTVRDGLIHRLYIYLDPDYAGGDTARYPWIQA